MFGTLLRIYLSTVLLTLLCDGLANLRLFRYRKDINIMVEFLTTVTIAFTPVLNLINSVQCLKLFFSSKEVIKRTALMIDIMLEE